MPPEARQATLCCATSFHSAEETIPVVAGGEVILEAVGPAETASLVVRSGGQEVWKGEGLASVRATWSRIEEGDTPPARREIPIPADTETLAVDEEVRPEPRRIANGAMTLSDYRTTVELAGPGAARFEFVPSEPPAEGRVRGAVRRRR